MRAACAPGAEGETREEKRGPSGSGGRGRWRREQHRGGEHVPANPLGEADGPPRARGGEGGAGRAAVARSLTSRDPHTRARARSARPGHRGLRRGPNLARLDSSHLHGPRPASRSPRRARIGSRGTPRRPAGRRRSGRPRGAGGEGEGAETEGGRRGIGTATLAPRREGLGRGASPARPRGRVRREDAPRRSERAAAGRVAGRNGIEGRKARRRPVRAPGPTRSPREGGRPRPLPNDTRSHPETGATRTPLQATPAHAPSLSGPNAHRAAAASTKAAAAGAAATATTAADPRHRHRPPDTHGSLFPTWIPADRPAGARTQGRTRPIPTPRRLDLTESSPPGTARGAEEARGRGGSADEGGSRAGTEEQGGRGGPEGKGAGRRARVARGGATAARPPPTTTPAHV